MAEWKRAGEGKGKSGFGGGKKGEFRKSFGRKDQGGERELFDAVCSNCGKDCQVPFKPSGKTPILCKECFVKSKETEGGRMGSGVRHSGDGDKKTFGTRTSFKGERSYAQKGEGDPRIGELEKGLAEANQKLDRLIDLVSGVTLASAVRKVSKQEDTDVF